MQATSILEDILAKYEGQGRDLLLPVLWDIQTYFGHISKEAVHQISHTLRVPEADIYGVISFYTLFHDKPTGKTIIRVCTDPSCALGRAEDVLKDVCLQIGLNEGESNEDYTIERSPCLGMCDQAPAVLVSKRGMGEVAIPKADAEQLLEGASHHPYQTVVRGEPEILLHGDHHELLDQYGEYVALQKALKELSPENLIQTMVDSGLIGRGGAAFPTGLKWRFTRQTDSSPKYIVCNADESEPGTFKDRVLMEDRPHLILEGMALAAYAIGAEKGYIFVRGEYPLSEQSLQEAIVDAEAAHLLGDKIMNTDFSFHVEVRRGAGAYICGEETALFEAIEGKRGFPRIKPPYPTTHGLFGKPTVVNNVETLGAVPGIIMNGAEWFKQFGTEKSTGTKLVSVSGHVNQAGVYEIKPGITLRELLDNFCGGVDGELKAILMGGAAGTFLIPDEINVKLTFEDLRAIGSTFGSGAIIVFNETVDILDLLRRLAHFFQHESCGKCFPCQLGTQRQLEILERDTFLEGDVVRLQDIGVTMTEASLCGLGQTAASAVLSAMDKWPELFNVK
jgi:NADH-quinone oxidoreductase subunit F